MTDQSKNIVRIATTPNHDPERLIVREHSDGHALVTFWTPIVVDFASFNAALEWARDHIEARGYPDMEITIREHEYVEGYGWREVEEEPPNEDGLTGAEYAELLGPMWYEDEDED